MFFLPYVWGWGWSMDPPYSSLPLSEHSHSFSLPSIPISIHSVLFFHLYFHLETFNDHLLFAFTRAGGMKNEKESLLPIIISQRRDSLRDF
jgi:hypothetical protein